MPVQHNYQKNYTQQCTTISTCSYASLSFPNVMVNRFTKPYPTLLRITLNMLAVIAVSPFYLCQTHECPENVRSTIIRRTVWIALLYVITSDLPKVLHTFYYFCKITLSVHSRSKADEMYSRPGCIH